MRTGRVGAVLVVALAVLGPATISSAQADLVVTGDGVRAVVERSPFRLLFVDARGREVLATVPDVPTAPQPQGAVERTPGGGTSEDAPSLYPPIGFIVGAEEAVQYPGGYWSTDILTGASAGVHHSLREVVAVEQVRDRLRLEVSTTDPTRTATVTVARDEGPTLRVSVRFSDETGIGVTTASFASGSDEHFHGFGGRRNATDQRGEDFYNWLEEFHQRPDEFEWVGDLPTLDETYQFPTGSQGAYYVQSSFISSRPYGFWMQRSELSRWRMTSDRDDAWQVGVAAPGIDFTVAPGDAPDAISSLTAITGRHGMPPAWALGPGLSRAVQTLSGGPEDYEEQVRADLDALSRLDLPMESFAIEGWPMLEELGVLGEIITRIRDLGMHPVGYYKAFVGGSDHTERDAVFDDAVGSGYVATTEAGTPFLFGSPVEIHKPAALIDFTDPDAVRWWKQRIAEGLDLGFDGFMQDFGEQTFIGMRFDDGSTGAEMHNRYPLLFHRATAEVIAEYEQAHPDREIWFYVRSGYTGRPGSAAHEHTSWGGDNTTDWSRASGIGSVIPDMLNRGLGGAYGYATDIGGYVDAFGRPTEELLIRWAQLASLIPVNRLHGSPVNGTHMPWEYGEGTVALYRATVERHIAAQPLIHALWEEGIRTGMPIARPLWLHHPDDERARQEEQQWLLGSDVLVAPVVEEGATSREVYFPQGCWQHPETGERHEGPLEEVVDAPLEHLPYYFRCGTRPFAAPGAVGSPAEGGRSPETLPATGAGWPAAGVLSVLAFSRIRAARRLGDRGRSAVRDGGRGRRSQPAGRVAVRLTVSRTRRVR